jgi:hypothetical protein
VLAAVGWRAGQKVDVDASGNPVKGCVNPGDSSGSNSCRQSPQNGLYESDTGTPGSFKFLPGGSGGVSGFAPNNVVGRTALAVAHGTGQNSDAVYALVEDAQKFNHCPDLLDQTAPSPSCDATVNGEAVATVLDGMYASYDFGKTWTKIMDWTQLTQPGTNSSIADKWGTARACKPGTTSGSRLTPPRPTPRAIRRACCSGSRRCGRTTRSSRAGAAPGVC